MRAFAPVQSTARCSWNAGNFNQLILSHHEHQLLGYDPVHIIVCAEANQGRDTMQLRRDGQVCLTNMASKCRCFMPWALLPAGLHVDFRVWVYRLELSIRAALHGRDWLVRFVQGEYTESTLCRGQDFRPPS